MKRLLSLSSAFTCLTLVAQTATGPLPNPGFEEGEAHWSLADHGMSKVAPEAAHSGRLGLRVADDSMRQYQTSWYSGVAREYPANVKAAWDVLIRRDPLLGEQETGVRDALEDSD